MARHVTPGRRDALRYPPGCRCESVESAWRIAPCERATMNLRSWVALAGIRLLLMMVSSIVSSRIPAGVKLPKTEIVLDEFVKCGSLAMDRNCLGIFLELNNIDGRSN